MYVMYVIYGMVWYGMVWYGMVWYGMYGHPHLPEPTLSIIPHLPGEGCFRFYVRCPAPPSSFPSFPSSLPPFSS